jgi:glyoxylase-like metal-dependent hydrolase (beta-lactamase superfamily II)
VTFSIGVNSMYTGDAYSTLGGVATAAKGHPWFPLVQGATWHKPTAIESAKALRALDPARIAPGHGKVVENPAAAMDAAIKRAE